MLIATLAPTAVLPPALNALAATVSTAVSLAVTFKSPALGTLTGLPASSSSTAI